MQKISGAGAELTRVLVQGNLRSLRRVLLRSLNRLLHLPFLVLHNDVVAPVYAAFKDLVKQGRGRYTP